VTPSDDERIAYLAGEPVEPLSANDRAELDELRALLRSPSSWAEPDPALEQRVVAAIKQETRRPGVRRRVRPPAFRRRFGLRRSAFALAGVVAAVAAVVLIALVVENTSPAAQRFAMVVSGTNLDPQARGSATLTKTSSGWRIELRASGLPRLANGRYYQAWLKNPAGILVPVGTFNDARQVTLWSGVPVTQFRTLTVTQQLANGNPASSAKRALIGTIGAPR
jgi:hypothetical protein